MDNDETTKENDLVDSLKAGDLFAEFVSCDENQIEEAELSEGPSAPKKVKNRQRYSQKYKKEWESKPECKGWLSESLYGSSYFYCKVCKNDYRCGISDVYKHMQSKKHAQNLTSSSYQLPFNFHGLLCPVFTPFESITSSRRISPISFDRIATYADFLHQCGVSGLLVNDIIGEGLSLTVNERMAVLDSWITCAKLNKQFVVVQVGGVAIKDIIDLCKHAHKLGADAIALLPDLYHKPANHLELIKYLKIIADHVNELPLLFHHYPKHSGIALDVQSFLIDITGEIDSFAGLIYTTDDLAEISRARHVNAEKYKVFMGTDEAILGAVASGIQCISSVSLNFLPKVVQDIVDSVYKGKNKSGQEAQKIISDIIEHSRNFGDAVAVQKAITEVLTGNLGGSTVRPPLTTVWDGLVKKMAEKFKDLGVMYLEKE